VDNSKRKNKRYLGKLDEVIPDVQAAGDPACLNIISGPHFGFSLNFSHFAFILDYFYARKSLGGFDTVEQINKSFNTQTMSIFLKYSF